MKLVNRTWLKDIQMVKNVHHKLNVKHAPQKINAKVKEIQKFMD